MSTRYTSLGRAKSPGAVACTQIADDNVVSFYYVPQISRYVRRHFESRSIGAMNVLSLLRNPLSNPLNRGIKRLFDIVFSSVFLVFSRSY